METPFSANQVPEWCGGSLHCNPSNTMSSCCKNNALMEENDLALIQDVEKSEDQFLKRPLMRRKESWTGIPPATLLNSRSMLLVSQDNEINNPFMRKNGCLALLLYNCELPLHGPHFIRVFLLKEYSILLYCVVPQCSFHLIACVVWLWSTWPSHFAK